jgi:hypothetical protein
MFVCSLMYARHKSKLLREISRERIIVGASAHRHP